MCTLLALKYRQNKNALHAAVFAQPEAPRASAHAATVHLYRADEALHSVCLSVCLSVPYQQLLKIGML